MENNSKDMAGQTLLIKGHNFFIMPSEFPFCISSSPT